MAKRERSEIILFLRYSHRYVMKEEDYNGAEKYGCKSAIDQ